MLILTRKPGETLVIDDEIKIMILSIKGNQIRLGVDAPKEREVYREELWYKVLENSAGRPIKRKEKQPEEDKSDE